MPTTIDLSGIRRAIVRVESVKDRAQLGLRNAESTLARRLLPFVKRDVLDEYNLPAARAAKDLSIRKDSQGGSALMITGYDRAIGKIEFSGQWGGRRTAGATAQVKKGAPRKTYDGAFIGNGMRGDRAKGNRHIFERTTRRRLPIQALYGPSVAQMLRRPGRIDRIAAFAQTVLAAEIKRGLG